MKEDIRAAIAESERAEELVRVRSLMLERARPVGPAPSGVYLLFKGGEIVYIGQSINLPARIASHASERGEAFDSYAAFRLPPEDLSLVERYLLALFEPPLNLQVPRITWPERPGPEPPEESIPPLQRWKVQPSYAFLDDAAAYCGLISSELVAACHAGQGPDVARTRRTREHPEEPIFWKCMVERWYKAGRHRKWRKRPYRGPYRGQGVWR